MKKILITGGAGFIGYHLGKKFINEGYKVDLVDNFRRGKIDFELKELIKNKNIKLIKNNLLNLNLKKWTRNYDKIFHLAAIIGVKHVKKNPYEVLTHNIKLLDNVIQIAKIQKKISKFIFFSTSEVYAGTLKSYGIKIPTPENTKLVIDDLNIKRTTYMLSKIYGEMMCNITDSLQTINIRPHNFYGPRMGFSHVIPELIKKIYFSKNSSVIIKSPNHKRTFCYIDDAIDIIYKLSTSNKTNSKTFNVGSLEKSITIYDLAKKINKILNKKTKLIKSYEEIGSPSNRSPDIKMLLNHIKVKFNYNLSSGLKETYDWYSKNIFKKKLRTFI